MKGLRSAVRLVFCLPALWVALAAMAAVVTANKEPFVDILRYAIERLAH